jgi:hypothetical protein
MIAGAIAPPEHSTKSTSPRMMAALFTSEPLMNWRSASSRWRARIPDSLASQRGNCAPVTAHHEARIFASASSAAG